MDFFISFAYDGHMMNLPGNLKGIGERIRARRERLELTQHEVAEAIGVTRSNYGKYENGRVDLNISTLQEIARVLQCSISYLVDENSDAINDEPPIIGYYRGLPPDDQDVAEAQIKFMHDRHRKRQTTHGKKAE